MYCREVATEVELAFSQPGVITGAPAIDLPSLGSQGNGHRVGPAHVGDGPAEGALAPLSHRGPEQLVNEVGAGLFEVTSEEAAKGFMDLMGDAVAISPTQILLQSAALASDWEDRLTKVLRDDPARAGVQI